jgi:hypothetical protein
MAGELIALCGQAFHDVGWDHSEPNAADAFGSSLHLEGYTIGGSARVYADTFLRFLAFAGRDVPDEYVSSMQDFFTLIHPTLLVGSLEIDPSLGVICRATLDCAAFFTEKGNLIPDRAVLAMLSKVLVDLATGATATLFQMLPMIDAVCEGKSAAIAFSMFEEPEILPASTEQDVHQSSLLSLSMTSLTS